jgi:Ni,Fe-hydrogenase III large subunit
MAKHHPLDSYTGFLERLRNQSILVSEDKNNPLPPVKVLLADAEDWGSIANEARKADMRWAAVWAEDRNDHLLISSCLEYHGEYLLLRCKTDHATPVLPSQTPYFPAADRPERHLQNMYGILFSDHPDDRRWIRHHAWRESEFPLRKDFPVTGNPRELTPPDDNYRFMQASGSGVYEIPVGPVHAGIIEPGHFRFQAVGETILNLEEHLGYVHKGIEKIAEGRDAAGLARLAGRVSGDTTVAHCWAACMAMERATGTTVPQRALILRAVMAERERIANHLGDIGSICNDVSFTFAHHQFARLRELVQRLNHELFGHRLMMDAVIPGGTGYDIDAGQSHVLKDQCLLLHSEVSDLMEILDDNQSLQDRLVNTGILTVKTAHQAGALGYVGRASGQPFDIRQDIPYAPYDTIDVDTPVFSKGDIASRLAIRSAEILQSADIIEVLLERLEPGEIAVDLNQADPAAEGIGFVEGWRGEIISFIRFDNNNRIARFYPRDPSTINWPTLEMIVRGNIVPEFPVCNKSVNGSYSGHDL